MDAPRPAATLILAREGPRGVEVLVERRSEESRFAAGFVVFPGGVSDPGDGDLAESLWGDPAEALRACALRELAEETSLAITGRGVEPAEAALAALRADPPPHDSLPEIARWIAPEFLEVRFDAVFFAAAAARGVEPRPDGVEISDAWWTPPDDVVVASVRGDAQLMWPTLVTLEELASCRTVEEVLALRIEQVHPPEPGEQPRRGRWMRPEYRA
ncbi:MAG TPA: NUDIX domain-containing protein [Actinomycetota bacterium]|nr:NUDIX domain-containing protein [Actinomycetota bacterium]